MPLRLFIAIDTPPEIKARILPILGQFKETAADVRWEPEEKLHATLKFLGNTDEGLLGRIISNLEEICLKHGKIPIVYSGLGFFPNARRPRVVWIGIKDLTGALGKLSSSLEDAMANLGFKREDRQFTPHLTIGRIRGEKRISPLLQELETVTFETEAVAISKLILVRSELKPGGSVYTILKSTPFGNG